MIRIEVDALTIDTPDPEVLATFWEGMLDYIRTFEDDGEVMIASPNGDGLPLLFLENDDEKVTKNRWHFDLRPNDQAKAVERALALGATHVDIGQHDDPDVTWVVLADPDGNEFCLLADGPPTVDVGDIDELAVDDEAVDDEDVEDEDVEDENVEGEDAGDEEE